MARLLAIGATLVALGVAGCGGDDGDEDGSAGATTEAEQTTAGAPPAEAEKERPGTEVKVSDSEFGSILFDSEDQAIYLFTRESSDRSECYGACAEAWPPVLTEGEPKAGRGAKGGLLGTTERRDGTTQVTYNGHPLYYYVDDGPNQVLCQDVEEFGGIWYVVQPSGEPVLG